MKDTECIEWVKREFLPLTLATPDEAILQFIANAKRYWNNHSAYKVTRMVSVSIADTGSGVVNVPADIRTVVAAYPSVMQEELFSNHPMWVLLGFITLDRYTQDLMLLSHTFEGYRIYLGNDFRWTFERGENPGYTSTSTGGKLFIQSWPRGASKVAIVGLKKFDSIEEVKDEFILDWILRYSKSLTKIAEGNTLRKSSIINISNDGQQLVDEGKEEVEKLQDELRKESRWALLMKRG